MLIGLGKLDPFLGIASKENEIYVLRLSLTGMNMTLLSEPLAVVEAVGRAFASGLALGLGQMNYDVRGIVLSGGGTTWVADVICTWRSSGLDIVAVFKDGMKLREELNADTKLKGSYPSLNVSEAGWYVLAGAEVGGEIAYWLAAPVLYDHTNGGKTTQAFDRGENVWWGTAEKRYQQWKPAVTPPIGPVPPKEEPKSSNTWLWVGLGGLALVGLWAYGKQKVRKR